MPAALFLTAVLGVPPLPVIELEGPANVYSIQAVVKTPVLGPRDSAALEVLGEILREGTKTFTAGEIRASCLEAGERLRIVWAPDHLRIGLGSTRLSDGLTMLMSILSEPKITQEAFERAVTALPYRSTSYWSQAVRQERPDFGQLRLPDVLELWARLMRPENVGLAVGGKFEPGEASRIWAAKTVAWTPERMPRLLSDSGASRLLAKLDGPVGVVELRGGEVNGAQVPATLFALLILGAGKTGALHQVVRNQLGVSYWQQAVLTPTPTGLLPRVLIPSKGADLAAVATACQAALGKDVDGWTDARLREALGVARRVLRYESTGFPLMPSGTRELGDSLADRAYLAAYWRMKTGIIWDADRMLAEFQNLSLEDVQRAAKGIVAAGPPVILPGRR